MISTPLIYLHEQITKHSFASDLDEYTVDIFASVNSFLGEFGFKVMNTVCTVEKKNSESFV